MSRHRPVMVDEVLEYLVTGPGDWICDATLGSAGHAEAILERLGPQGRLIGLDRDERALERARRHLGAHGERVVLRVANFRNMAAEIAPIAPGGVDGVLMDLGVSSEQLDEPGSGFSFMAPGPLSMTMEPGRHPDAADLVNSAPAPELARVLKEYGDVRFARRVAGAIVAARPLSTTTDLADAARRAGASRPDSLARVFQAIRIAVNDELGALAAGLDALEKVLKPGGRAVVLAYHSGEDRIVKRFFKPERLGKPLPWVPEEETPAWELLTRRAVKASADEVKENSRSRSARLRAARRVTG